MRAARGEGTRRIMIMVPPQHGKSTLSSQYFPAWFVGRNPDKRIVLASYETSYAETWGRKVRDVLEAHGKDVFGITVRPDMHAAGRWDVCDAATGKPREGGMTATGVGGPITGKKADLLLIDDPIKDDEEAQSEVDREKKYQWYLSVALTRVSEHGVIVIIMTRWHESDLVGRLIRDEETGGGEKFEKVRLPAIAEEDERWIGHDGSEIFARRKGEALCPQLFSLETLRKREAAMEIYNWARLYQQRPFAKGGGMFNITKLEERKLAARPLRVVHARGWDFAATKKDGSDRSAGVRISKDVEGHFYIEHCVAGKWNPDERNAKMKSVSHKEKSIKILFEQDPGQAGVDQALAITRLLVGCRVEAVPQMGRNKVLRADIAAAQVNGGNVSLVDDGTWDVDGFLHELEAFPNGDHDDRIDALSVAFNWLINKKVEIGPGGGEPQRTRGPHEPEKQTVGSIGASDWRSEMAKLQTMVGGKPDVMPDVGQVNNFGNDNE